MISNINGLSSLQAVYSTEKIKKTLNVTSVVTDENASSILSLSSNSLVQDKTASSKMAALKKQIANGTYKVDTLKIAQGFIKTIV